MKQEIIEDKPVETPKDEPPKDAKNDEPPPGPLALDAEGQGPGDGFDLGGKPGGKGFLGGGGGGGGSRWGWYAGMVQSQIESALRANQKTRNAVMRVQVRLWSDGTGRVNRVQLVVVDRQSRARRGHPQRGAGRSDAARAAAEGHADADHHSRHRTQPSEADGRVETTASRAFSNGVR